jgi:subtilisin family serine protease
MKRFLNPLILSCLFSLILVLIALPLSPRAQADSGSDSLDHKISREILQKVSSGNGSEHVRVIIQPKGVWDTELETTVEEAGGTNFHSFQNFKVRDVTISANAAANLAARNDVAYISLNREVRSLGHVSATTGADQVRVTSGTNANGFDGTGIGIAVVDSGIDSAHKAFLDRSNNVRVVYNEDFTGEGRVDDPYGHGTHVAALAAGNGRISNSQYVGVAPNANILNLRVLNSQGIGTTGGVLRALDWIATNRELYNIRVVNMSLGMPAIDSYRNDPVCRAVRRLVDSGVVVFAAAGNNGADANGNRVYGHIHSPGNEPSAITVGASNTFGTDGRSDDGVASYSSRGPTRSFSVDENGTVKYDNLVKPDIVAPGNRLIEAQAANNLLVNQNPALDAGVSPVDNRKMMYLSGSSMATPVAAGVAALMLQANPTLSPNIIKALMMYTAQPLAGFNMLEQGAGQVNAAGAVKLAALVRRDLGSTTAVGEPLLTTNDLPVQETTIGNQTFTWSRGIILNYTYATGSELITKYQGIYRTGSVLGDGIVTGDGVVSTDPTMLSEGIVTGDHILTSNGIVTGDGTPFLAVVFLIGQNLPDGELIGNGIITGDGIVTGDGIITGDFVAIAQSATMNGDESTTMAAELDDGADCLDY